MKKIMTAVAAIAVLFTLVACGDSNNGNSVNPTSNETSNIINNGSNLDITVISPNPREHVDLTNSDGSGRNAESNNESGDTDGNRNDDSSDNSGTISNDYGDVNDFDWNAVSFDIDYINNNMPNEYWIVYHIDTYDGSMASSTVMELKKTPEGYYFVADDEEGQLFIKNGANYDVYMDSGNGVHESTFLTLPADTVEAMMYAMTAYMTVHASLSSVLQKDGSETVAGRDCAIYTYNMDLPGLGYNYLYRYSIDKQTGICLRCKIDLASTFEKIGYEFDCLKFETSGVKLPEYQ